MIEHLDINNVALIKHGEIDFSPGLNIISGETGSGKSMVIQAVRFMLGQRTSKDFIRHGEDKAVVSGLFSICNNDVLKIIRNKGIELAEDNALLIERSVSRTGKSSVKINGKTISLAILKEISSLLLDIHSQHDHQSLLNSSKHLEVLDAFCPDELVNIKEQLGGYLREYKDLSKRATEIVARSGKSGEKVTILKLEIEEIENATLQDGEEESLHSQHKTLLQSENIKENTKKIMNILYEDMEDINALRAINTAIRLLGEVSEMDSRAGFMLERLNSISIDLEELKRDISDFDDRIDTDGNELKRVESRIESIYSLKRKYGSDIEKILKYLEEAKQEYNSLINATEILNKINIRRKELNKLIVSACDNLHKARKVQAEIIENQIESVLKELAMANAKFKIDIVSKKEFGPNGNDKVNFLISPNLGEDLKELDKIASGGEMSRVMLALKSILSKADNIETFIFDEIDTGVSGRTAQKVAEKLCFISRYEYCANGNAIGQQIICITHLPQIAAMGDNHLLIEKLTQGERTITEIKNLDRKAQINEIARMIGGVAITDRVSANATELKEMADNFKSLAHSNL